MSGSGIITIFFAGVIVAVIVVLVGGGISHALLATPVLADGSKQFDGGFTRGIMVLLDGCYTFTMGLIGMRG